MILCVSVVSFVASSFSFLSCLVWAHSKFFLMTLAKGLLIFVYPFRELAFGFVDFFSVVFVVSISFISALYDFFSSFGFCFPFSSCFRLGCLFVTSLVSWGKLVLLWMFLELLFLCPIGFGLLCFYLHLGVLISSLISPMTHWLFSNILFSLQAFVGFFAVFFLVDDF